MTTWLQLVRPIEQKCFWSEETSAMNKEIKIGIAVMAIAILISGGIGYRLSTAHQADCENHRILLEQAQRDLTQSVWVKWSDAPSTRVSC